MKLIFLAALLGLISIKTTESCEIASHTVTPHGRTIDVTCEHGTNLSLKLQDGDDISTMIAYGKRMGEVREEFLRAESYQKSNMSITLLGKRLLDLEHRAEDRLAAIENLRKNPYFSYFPAVSRLIHDELNLPGWESPSVMMLYKIGMSIPPPAANKLSRKRRDIFSEMLKEVFNVGSAYDRSRVGKMFPRLFAYHGPENPEACQGSWLQRKETFEDAVKWIMNDKCKGMCGLGCWCWTYVCGDCCIRPSCTVHDGYCRSEYYGKLSYECLGFKAVVNEQYITLREKSSYKVSDIDDILTYWAELASHAGSKRRGVFIC